MINVSCNNNCCLCCLIFRVLVCEAGAWEIVVAIALQPMSELSLVGRTCLSLALWMAVWTHINPSDPGPTCRLKTDSTQFQIGSINHTLKHIQS